jgi:hypothetical protein
MIKESVTPYSNGYYICYRKYRGCSKKFEKENKNITLLQIIDGEEIRIESNY